MNDALIDRLDALINVLARPKIPADRELWDSNQASSYLGMSARNFSGRIACKPDFPRAIRLADIKGGMRWKAQEVMDWVENRREKRAAA